MLGSTTEVLMHSNNKSFLPCSNTACRPMYRSFGITERCRDCTPTSSTLYNVEPADLDSCGKRNRYVRLKSEPKGPKAQRGLTFLEVVVPETFGRVATDLGRRSFFFVCMTTCVDAVRHRSPRPRFIEAYLLHSKGRVLIKVPAMSVPLHRLLNTTLSFLTCWKW